MIFACIFRILSIQNVNWFSIWYIFDHGRYETIIEPGSISQSIKQKGMKINKFYNLDNRTSNSTAVKYFELTFSTNNWRFEDKQLMTPFLTEDTFKSL